MFSLCVEETKLLIQRETLVSLFGKKEDETFILYRDNETLCVLPVTKPNAKQP